MSHHLREPGRGVLLQLRLLSTGPDLDWRRQRGPQLQCRQHQQHLCSADGSGEQQQDSAPAAAFRHSAAANAADEQTACHAGGQ